MSEQSRDQWAKALLTSTLELAWHASEPQARRVADAAAVEVEKVERRADREASGFRVMCEALERLEQIVGLDTGGGMGPGPALNAVEHIVKDREILGRLLHETNVALQEAETERDAAQAKLAAIGRLSPTDYEDREQLLGALFRILRGIDEGGE